MIVSEEKSSNNKNEVSKSVPNFKKAIENNNLAEFKSACAQVSKEAAVTEEFAVEIQARTD